MRNFVKTALVTFGIASTVVACSPAQAADSPAVLGTNIASYCTVGMANPGVMHISGTTVSTDVPAVLYVNANEASGYKVSTTDAGDFYVKPNGYTGTATMTTSMEMSGANTASIASGVEQTLVNAGQNTLNVSVSGTTSVEPITGYYEAVSTVSCVAL